MREAVGGIVWDKVYADASILTLFGIAAILIGAFLKKPINHYTNKLKKRNQKNQACFIKSREILSSYFFKNAQ